MNPDFLNIDLNNPIPEIRSLYFFYPLMKVALIIKSFHLAIEKLLVIKVPNKLFSNSRYPKMYINHQLIFTHLMD